MPGASDCLRASARHVRLRRARARQRPADAGARPFRHQAAVPRADRRRAALRVDAAGAARRRRHRHRDRRRGAESLHVVACGGAGAAAPSCAACASSRRPASCRSTPTARAGQPRLVDARSRRGCGDSPRCRPASARRWSSAALRLAVERRMVADVPVGVLLSGGVDSSLIVGLLAETGPAQSADLLDRLRRGRWRSRRRIPLLRPGRRTLRHRPPPDPHPDRRADGRAARHDRRDARADGQLRQRRVLPAVARGREADQGGAERPGRRRGLRRLPLVSEAGRRRRRPMRRRLPRAPSSTARRPRWRRSCIASMLSGDASADFLAAPFRPHAAQLAGREGAAHRHHGDAGRRPGQARRQHDDGLGPGGAGAVPRPRTGRAGRPHAGRPTSWPTTARAC